MRSRSTVLLGAVFFLCLGIFSQSLYGASDFGPSQVLPQGRYQAIFRFGHVSSIQDKFNSQGVLQSPSRMNIRYSNEFLMKQEEFQKLSGLLNQIYPNQNLGEKLDFGSVEFKGQAQVNYFSPQLSRGLTPNWSVGFAVPIVKYQSNIHAVSSGISTAEPVMAMISQGHISELTNNPMIDSSSKGAAELTQALLTRSDNGYKPISSRNSQFVGDVILGSVYKMYEKPKWALFLSNNLTLPTGPKDDPDDLLDLTIFGKTDFQTMVSNTYYISRWLEAGMGVYYNWAIQDHISKRVPRAEGDILPPASTKEKLTRDPGDSYGVQLSLITRWGDFLELGTGYDFGEKQSDKFFGSQGRRYDLLERNTNTNFGIVRFKAVYTTVESFLQGGSKIPYSLTYAFSDYLSGKNVERQLNHELLLKFYF